MPFLGIAMIIKMCLTDWDEIKVPVLTMLTGIVLALLGYGGWIGTAVMIGRANL